MIIKLKKPNLKNISLKKLSWKRILKTTFFIFKKMTEKIRLIIKLKKPNLKNISLKKLNWKKILRTSLFIFMGFAVVGSGAAIGVYKAIMQNLPDISQIEEFEPKIITTLFAEDEEIIGEYAEEKRIEIKFEDIPEILTKSIIATEDPRFYSHKGIDYLGILRAVKAD
ncbi:MAG: transglycosylase domain-containing protein, partial [Candidatus Aminicenantes bacterium]|nr:transglycosylase domain-containing protein [Candidatus Aminicenantes bacterium]